VFLQDLLAGHIDLTFTQVASALAQVRSGQVKAYVVMAKTRWAEAPDTPSIDEKRGVPGLYASFWHGLWAPRGTPKPRDKQTPEALENQDHHP
jgi:tripartite-type tricarboxylate transporter receptor subunit TctC